MQQNHKPLSLARLYELNLGEAHIKTGATGTSREFEEERKKQPTTTSPSLPHSSLPPPPVLSSPPNPFPISTALIFLLLAYCAEKTLPEGRQSLHDFGDLQVLRGRHQVQLRLRFPEDGVHRKCRSRLVRRRKGWLRDQARLAVQLYLLQHSRSSRQRLRKCSDGCTPSNNSGRREKGGGRWFDDDT